MQNQTPLLLVPIGKTRYVGNPVCCRCGPPPAPERPYIIRTGKNEVKLEWYNPEFDGIPASKYRIFMFNVSRTFKTWRPIEYSNDICTTRFLVRNLPMGVPCQFKVAAYNNGGWGELSEESLLAIPGEEQTPLSAALRWKRLTMGGPISLMDRLDFYPKHRMEHVDGLQKILQFALQTGLKKGTIANRATLLCLRALQTFPDDPDIACSAFRMMGICLRSPKQHKKIKVILTQHGIRELCDHYSHKFRSNSAIINGIVLIRSGMMKWINPIPDIIPPEDDEDKKKGEEEDDNSTDEEEEKKGSS